MTGGIWANASGKVPKPNRPPGNPEKRRRACGGPPLSAAARAALESAAQERLLELVGVLQEVARALKSVAAALPPPSGEASVTVELRAAIDCVLADSLGPAIETLRAAAVELARGPAHAERG